jgi:hypothetical protein
MNQIPESLRQLWATRDHAAKQRKVSLQSIDEFLSEDVIESKQVVVSQNPLMQNIALLKNVPLFPTYSLALPSVSLNNYVRTHK